MKELSRRIGCTVVALVGVALAMPALAAECAPTNVVAKTRLQQLAEKMIPQEKLDEAVGFFGPVTKKYLPVWNEFCGKYRAAADKRAVVVEYMPQVDAALADAKAMKVPAKYETKKTEYLRMFEAFVFTAKLYVRLGK